MWKLLYKIKELAKRGMLDFHRNMLRIKNDAVLIVIYIWRILEAPPGTVDGHRNNAVVLACGMIYPACIAFIFLAEQALRISGLGRIFRRRNGLGVFFRFG